MGAREFFRTFFGVVEENSSKKIGFGSSFLVLVQ